MTIGTKNKDKIEPKLGPGYYSPEKADGLIKIKNDAAVNFEK